MEDRAARDSTHDGNFPKDPAGTGCGSFGFGGQFGLNSGYSGDPRLAGSRTNKEREVPMMGDQVRQDQAEPGGKRSGRMKFRFSTKVAVPLVSGILTVVSLGLAAPPAGAANVINVGGSQTSSGGGLLGGLNVINALGSQTATGGGANAINVGGTQTTGGGGGLLGGLNVINALGSQTAGGGALLGGLNVINAGGVQQSCSGLGNVINVLGSQSTC